MLLICYTISSQIRKNEPYNIMSCILTVSFKKKFYSLFWNDTEGKSLVVMGIVTLGGWKRGILICFSEIYVFKQLDKCFQSVYPYVCRNHKKATNMKNRFSLLNSKLHTLFWKNVIFENSVINVGCANFQSFLNLWCWELVWFLWWCCLLTGLVVSHAECLCSQLSSICKSFALK